jgi:anaerobic sulfite reductase subunit B
MAYEMKKYKVASVKEETSDVKLFKIKTDMNPLPGQFFQVSLLGIGECPLASCSYNTNEVDILMRKAGTVTSALFNLKKGDSIFLRGPYGQGFPIKELEGKNLIFIAGGTGIAPVTSLIEYVEKNPGKFKKIEIYFGFRNKEYILLKEIIEKWKKKFKVIITLDKADKDWTGEVGFLNDIILRNSPQKENSLALLCGPEIMMEKVSESLNKLGVDNSRIYWSLERRMECGFGNCGRCLIADIYVCKDGPVFRYDLIKHKLENENSNASKK